MGQTQHTVGTANVRASCIVLLATGNVGGFGNGANIFRGHDNVQGATDIGLDVTSLPLYYGLAEGAWRHWGRVWEVDYDWLLSRFDVQTAADGKPVKMMEASGIPSTRWFDAIMLPKDQVAQKDNVQAMFVFGHGGNTITRMPESAEGDGAARAAGGRRSASDHLGVARGHGERKDNTYLLPICTQFETSGSRIASNRSLQWGEQIVKPIFECKDDYEAIYLMAKKLGFADLMFKNIKVEGTQPVSEDILREINRGGWSTGYSGQSPERLKLHMANQKDFDLVTMRAKDGPAKGDYYGLPWPCWGTPELQASRHPHALQHQLHVMDGGGTFRARFGVEREEKLADGTTVKVNLLAEGSYSLGSEIKDGYPEFTDGVLKKLGWDEDLTAAENAPSSSGSAAPIRRRHLVVDSIFRAASSAWRFEHGCIPFGNGKARANAWTLPDPIPVHREPIYTPRPDLVAKYPTRPDERQFRLPNIGFTVQKLAVDKGIAKQFPLILSSGRLVEFEGGGEETRSNKWLAELQQDMFVEINPSDAAERGVKDGGFVLVWGPEMVSGKVTRVKALVTERVGKGVVWMPFHFAGVFQNVDQRGKYPPGCDPIVIGESVNAITTYGFDPVTGMQEPKATLCQIRAA